MNVERCGDHWTAPSLYSQFADARYLSIYVDKTSRIERDVPSDPENEAWSLSLLNDRKTISEISSYVTAAMLQLTVTP
jgi:hypothetical protein